MNAQKAQEIEERYILAWLAVKNFVNDDEINERLRQHKADMFEGGLS